MNLERDQDAILSQFITISGKHHHKIDFKVLNWDKYTVLAVLCVKLTGHQGSTDLIVTLTRPKVI